MIMNHFIFNFVLIPLNLFEIVPTITPFALFLEGVGGGKTSMISNLPQVEMLMDYPKVVF